MAAPKPEKMGPREAGKRGGQATSKRYGSEFYSEIGQRGGLKVSSDREHMARIGRRGGRSGRR